MEWEPNTDEYSFRHCLEAFVGCLSVVGVSGEVVVEIDEADWPKVIIASDPWAFQSFRITKFGVSLKIVKRKSMKGESK